MRNNIVHCSKIPDLLSIDSNRVDIFLEYFHDNKIKSFSVANLDLRGINLPPDATVELVCETSLKEIFYPLGTPSNIQKIQVDLSEYKLSQKPKFRIIVFVPGNPKLLAATDNVRIRNSDEDSSSKSLLSVNCVDNLGDRLWKLQISDSGVTLNVNSNQEVNMVRLLKENILVWSMVLPEAIDQVLEYIIMKAEDTSRQWIQDWKVFAEQYAVDLFAPDLKNDEEARSTSINKVVRGWCKSLSLCERIVAFNETEENRS